MKLGGGGRGRIQILCLVVLAGSFIWVVGGGQSPEIWGKCVRGKRWQFTNEIGVLKNKEVILARWRFRGFGLKIEGEAVAETPTKIVVRL